MTATTIFKLITLTLLSTYLANAATVSKRIIFSPQIFSPNASTVWTIGAKETVTWNASNLPSDVLDGIVQVSLVQLSSNASGEFLAQNTSLAAGSVDIEVPCVTAGNDFEVIVWGDSGNRSPQFTIKNSTTSCSVMSTTVTSTSVTSVTVVQTPTSASSSPATTSFFSGPTSAGSGAPTSTPASTASGTTSSQTAAATTSASAAQANRALGFSLFAAPLLALLITN